MAPIVLLSSLLRWSASEVPRTACSDMGDTAGCSVQPASGAPELRGGTTAGGGGGGSSGDGSTVSCRCRLGHELWLHSMSRGMHGPWRSAPT